jgi:hypothetical protein
VKKNKSRQLLAWKQKKSRQSMALKSRMQPWQCMLFESHLLLELVSFYVFFYVS